MENEKNIAEVLLTDKENKEQSDNPLSTKPRITEEDVSEAIKTLKDYKASKATLEQRIIAEEEFWKMQPWNIAKKQSGRTETEQKPMSAWSFNVIMSKHADLMDNYPIASMLPREKNDEQDAKTLSQIIPVIVERNEFEQTYSNASWYKLKHGTCAYGVFWNNDLENGLGDIDIKHIDLLNVFWEPGISDIQDSKNIFVVDLIDNEMLEVLYPDKIKNIRSSRDIEIGKYITDESVDTNTKSLVVDWYYKVKTDEGKTLLHYCKFVGNTILFASENEPEYKDVGWYEHGMYPIVFDVLYPESGTPYGFGFIAITQGTQMHIDMIDDAIMKYAKKIGTTRFFIKDTGGISEQEFANWDNELVHVAGNINDDNIKQITVQQLSNMLYNIRQMKIDELKETSANRDFANGGTTSGVTSGAAIATLQEAGNKTSRDIINTSYRSYVKIIQLTIELIRQFYTEERSFRVTGENNQGYEFTSYSNANLMTQPAADYNGDTLYRKPIFDIDVKAEKRNPYSKLSQNETASNLYQLGAFNPQNAPQALIMLEMMDFEGKDKIIELIRQGQGQLYGQASMPQENAMHTSMTSVNPVVQAQNNAEQAKNYAERLVQNANASAGKGMIKNG